MPFCSALGLKYDLLLLLSHCAKARTDIYMKDVLTIMRQNIKKKTLIQARFRLKIQILKETVVTSSMQYLCL